MKERLGRLRLSGWLIGQAVAVPGRRHLTSTEAAATLRRKREVEQFLGRFVASDERMTVRWLTAYPSGADFKLVLHEVEDIGSDEFLDVTEFPPLDENEYLGEGRVLSTHSDPDALLRDAAERGASPDRWVNGGVVQDEYRESRTDS